MKRIRIFTALFAMTAAVLACASPLDVLPTSAPSNVETIVALTFQALTPSVAATPPAETSSLLPYSLYFLNNDAAGLPQVFRLEKDGRTVKQITFEPVKVDGYDASPVDGSVVYVSANQLLLINPDGSNRRVLVTGGPTDPNNPFVNSVSSPVWSPNGQTIAYGHGGLNFYSVATGVSNRVLENRTRDTNGLVFPDELYWPDEYSPDGSKLIVTLGYYEGVSFAIYYPAGNALVRMTGDNSTYVCCNGEWSQDGTAIYSALSTLGMFEPGMWRVDAASGVVTTLLKGNAGDGTFNFAGYPHVSPDGGLYYFFANNAPEGEFASRAPLQLVRSAPDGVTGRTVLRPETFNLLNDALWAPDASFVIVANAPIQDVYQGGQAELIFADGRPAVVLLPFALEMKWGP